MTVDHDIDPANGIKPVEIILLNTKFLGEIFIDNKNQALRKVKKDHAGLVILANGSKLSDSRCGAAIC